MMLHVKEWMLSLNRKQSLLILLSIAFLLYFNSLFNSYSLDDHYVTNNKLIAQGIRAFPEICTGLYTRLIEDNPGTAYGYRPLIKLTFAMEYSLWGFRPFMSHLMNLLLYMLLIYLLFRLFHKYLWPNRNFEIFIILLLFTVHPVHTEVVNSLKNRDELLSFIFIILSSLCFFRWDNRKNYLWLLPALLFFMLSLLSKSSSLTFMAVIPLMLFMFGKGKTYRSILVFLILIIFFYSILRLPQKFLPEHSRFTFFYENPLFEVQGIINKIPTGIHVLWFYLTKLFFPFPLICYYGYDMIPLRTFSDWTIYPVALLHLSLFVTAILYFSKKNMLSFGILFYFISISMFSNIIKPIFGIVAERLLFIPSLGFCISVGYLLSRFVQSNISFFSNKKTEAYWKAIPLFLLFIALSFLTIQRNFQWKNQVTLLKHDIRYMSKSAHGNALYANTLLNKYRKEGNTDLSLIIKYYQKTLDIYPEYFTAWNNLGALYMEHLHNYEIAATYFNHAIESAPFLYMDAYFNLGQALELMHRYKAAIEKYQKCLEINPDFVEARSNMANAYFKSGTFDTAKEINMQIIREYPNKVYFAYKNLWNYYLITKDSTQAEKYKKLYEEHLPPF